MATTESGRAVKRRGLELVGTVELVALGLVVALAAAALAWTFRSGPEDGPSRGHQVNQRKG